MERFMQRDSNVLVRYTPQRPSMDPSSSTSSLRSSGDVDFHDVFGGPPRRYSSQDARHGMSSEARELSRYRGGGGGGGGGGAEEDGAVMSGGVRRAGLGDRPVFGEEGGTNNRRRYPSQDFFDDIFRGGEDSKDPYASSPGSRIMSPARPLPPPPNSDPFSSYLPSQFSLPTRVNKGMDLPSFGSSNRNLYTNQDDPEHGPIAPPSRSNSQSRLSSQSSKGQDELRTDARSAAYRQSPLSIEFSLGSDGSVKVTESETDSGEALKKDLNSSNVPIADSNQFHFSIYKWASKGVPLMVSLRGSKGSKVKDGNLSKSLSSNGRIVRDGVVNESPTETLPAGVDLSSSRRYVFASTESNTEVCVKETVVIATPEKDIVVDSVRTDKVVSDDTILKSKPNSPIGKSRPKKEKVATKTVEAAHKPESQFIQSVLFENDDRQGKDKASGGTVMKENTSTTTVKSPTNVASGRTLRKRDANKANDEVEKVASQTSPIQTADSVERNKIKGKVKGFVKIFNKETTPKRMPISDTQNQSCEWKGASSVKGDKEMNAADPTIADEVLHGIKTDQGQKAANAEDKPRSPTMKPDKDKKSANAEDKPRNPTMKPDKEQKSANAEDKPRNPAMKPVKEQKSANAEDKPRNPTMKPDKEQKSANPAMRPDKDKKSENAEYKPSSTTINKEKTPTNSSVKVDKYSKQPKEHTIFTLDDVYNQKNVRRTIAPVTDDSRATFTTMDDFFDEEFSVKEISEDQHMLITQSGKDGDDFKVATDAKIRGWASGKETNIRSLLSTLQYVLWPESGWKPVPLVDIIEANAVKRSYQRALLYLHPDKLQQKGADAHMKYIAEQVFDKLQDAWIHFNSLSTL